MSLEDPVAGKRGALVVCFPVCFIPGYRWPDAAPPSPDPAFLARAWAAVDDAARAARITTVLGTERLTEVICHEGWRYPETVRWAVRRGAQVVFHPHAHHAEDGTPRPRCFADPANSFHEKAVLCRAAENTCWFASANCASEDSGTTSAIARPDGTLLTHQPYGKEGLLVADLDLREATGMLASRLRTSPI